MTWSDMPFKTSARTLRQFAVACLVLLPLAGIYHRQQGHGTLAWILMIAGVVIGPLGILSPTSIRWLFVGLMIVAFPIGWLVSQIALAMMFYLVVTPVALVFRLSGRDVLRRKYEPGRPSFWVDKPAAKDVRSYFRQY